MQHIVACVFGNTPGTRNKLRTYRNIKNTFTAEPHLQLLISYQDRRALARFRCGVAPLAIETGRYTRQPVSERLCQMCDSGAVEDKLNFLLYCPFHTINRQILFNCAISTIPSFQTMPDMDKFQLLLCHKDILKSTARTIRLSLDERNAIFIFIMYLV